MRAGLFHVSARRRRKLKIKWKRADEMTVRRRQEELGFDPEAARDLEELLRIGGDFSFRRRVLIVINWADGWPPGYLAEALRCDTSTVHRVLDNYRKRGPAGLADGRSGNGERKVDARFKSALRELVRKDPPDFGEVRPTWTIELLIKVAARKTRVTVSPGTMSRALCAIRARWGRPRPTVSCPWPERSRKRRVNALTRMIEHLPDTEVAFWSDEVDIHLNPKIGPNWMLECQQKEVMTPGKNVKRYLAGAMHAVSGRIVYVAGERKASALFIALLWKLLRTYRRYRVIHVILDNFCIHKSLITQRALVSYGGKIVLHFLPPYCPNDNPIERAWEDLHANVTRCHRQKMIGGLMRNVRRHVDTYRHSYGRARQRKAA